MTGYVSLDAYEQFCENYENYSPIDDVITQTIRKFGGIGLASGLGAGGLGMAGMGIKGKMAEKALEEAAKENLLKGGLIGAGAIGAGVLGTKAIKKLLKKKNKKPFNNPSFSEYYSHFQVEPLDANPDLPRGRRSKPKLGTTGKSAGSVPRGEYNQVVNRLVSDNRENVKKFIEEQNAHQETKGQLASTQEKRREVGQRAGKRVAGLMKENEQLQEQLAKSRFKRRAAGKRVAGLMKDNEQLQGELSEAQGIINGARVPGVLEGFKRALTFKSNQQR